MNFAAIDLNLLRVFDAMTIELNTTRAGERVGLSQPAVSRRWGACATSSATSCSCARATAWWRRRAP